LKSPIFILSKFYWIWGCLKQNRPIAFASFGCKDGTSPITAGPPTDNAIPVILLLIADEPLLRFPLSVVGPCVVRSLRCGIPEYPSIVPASLILVRIRRFVGVPAAVEGACCCCLENNANTKTPTPPKRKRNSKFLRSCCMMNLWYSGCMFVAARTNLVVPS